MQSDASVAREECEAANAAAAQAVADLEEIVDEVEGEEDDRTGGGPLVGAGGSPAGRRGSVLAGRRGSTLSFVEGQHGNNLRLKASELPKRHSTHARTCHPDRARVPLGAHGTHARTLRAHRWRSWRRSSRARGRSCSTPRPSRSRATTRRPTHPSPSSATPTLPTSLPRSSHARVASPSSERAPPSLAPSLAPAPPFSLPAPRPVHQVSRESRPAARPHPRALGRGAAAAEAGGARGRRDREAAPTATAAPSHPLSSRPPADRAFALPPAPVLLPVDSAGPSSTPTMMASCGATATTRARASPQPTTPQTPPTRPPPPRTRSASLGCRAHRAQRPRPRRRELAQRSRRPRNRRMWHRRARRRWAGTSAARCSLMRPRGPHPHRREGAAWTRPAATRRLARRGEGAAWRSGSGEARASGRARGCRLRRRSASSRSGAPRDSTHGPGLLAAALAPRPSLCDLCSSCAYSPNLLRPHPRRQERQKAALGVFISEEALRQAYDKEKADRIAQHMAEHIGWTPAPPPVLCSALRCHGIDHHCCPQAARLRLERVHAQICQHFGDEAVAAVVARCDAPEVADLAPCSVATQTDGVTILSAEEKKAQDGKRCGSPAALPMCTSTTLVAAANPTLRAALDPSHRSLARRHNLKVQKVKVTPAQAERIVGSELTSVCNDLGAVIGIPSLQQHLSQVGDLSTGGARSLGLTSEADVKSSSESSRRRARREPNSQSPDPRARAWPQQRQSDQRADSSPSTSGGRGRSPRCSRTTSCRSLARPPASNTPAPPISHSSPWRSLLAASADRPSTCARQACAPSRPSTTRSSSSRSVWAPASRCACGASQCSSKPPRETCRPPSPSRPCRRWQRRASGAEHPSCVLFERRS